MVIMPDAAREELLTLNRRLLDAIDGRDWETYCELCDPTLTCFEPEAIGHLVSGMPFHRYYFQLEGGSGPKQSTISSPDVRLMGEVAVVTYVRLIQELDAGGAPVTRGVEETRIWQKQAGVWKHVHFHRSAG
jgi:calcium/calmodulin-dependent protein kinase (CaM kinase) II